MLLLLQNSFLDIPMLISWKPIQKRGIDEKCGFLLLFGNHQKII